MIQVIGQIMEGHLLKIGVLMLISIALIPPFTLVVFHPGDLTHSLVRRNALQIIIVIFQQGILLFVVVNQRTEDLHQYVLPRETGFHLHLDHDIPDQNMHEEMYLPETERFHGNHLPIGILTLHLKINVITVLLLDYTETLTAIASEHQRMLIDLIRI